MSVISNVWFASVDDGTNIASAAERLKATLVAAGFRELITRNVAARVKMHFGEEGNTGYVRPRLIRVIADMVAEQEGRLILSDTNTLYRGRRMNSRDHLQLAGEHGFTGEVTGAELEIPDEKDDGNICTVPCSGRFIPAANVMKCFLDAGLLIGVAHFKGHLMTGFGGALKNIGMGCASREGKLVQHGGIAPFVNTKQCTGCGACIMACPVDAITLVKNVARLDAERCIGCASCIPACESEAIEVAWGHGIHTLSGRMVEYAAAALSGKGHKIFVNFALHITAECDCLAQDDPSIVPDIGILVSTDPVAIDQASYDLACSKAGGFDPFSKAHPGCRSTLQLDYAEQLGIGSRRYELVTAPS